MCFSRSKGRLRAVNHIKTTAQAFLLSALLAQGLGAQTLLAPRTLPQGLPVVPAVTGLNFGLAPSAGLRNSPLAASGLSLFPALLLPVPLIPAVAAPRAAAASALAPASALRAAPKASFAPAGLAHTLRDVTAVSPQESAADRTTRERERLDRIFDGTQGRSAVDVPAVNASPKTAQLRGTEGLSGSQLFFALHDIARQGHQAHEYRDAMDYLFGTADNFSRNGRRGVADIYSGVFVPGTSNNGPDYREPGDANGDGINDSEGMNVEHLWPQSYFEKRLPMKSDLHHLAASFKQPNGIRGRLPFGVAADGSEYHNKAGARSDGRVFEPPDEAKGRVARALMYFFVRYYDGRIFSATGREFWNETTKVLLRWNQEHPVTEFERRRNNLVEAFQGNRNPFVDDPSLAERIGIEALRRPGTREGGPSSVAEVSGREDAPSERDGYTYRPGSNHHGKPSRDHGRRKEHRREASFSRY